VVANKKGKSISIIDLASITLSTPQPVGRDPHGIAIHPSLNIAVVANKKDNTVSILSLPDGDTTAIIPVGKKPRNVAIHIQRKEALVTQSKDDTLTLIDLTTNLIITTIPVGKDPHGVAVDENTGTVVVANKKDNTLSRIDLSTRAVTATFPVADDPVDVAMHPAPNTALVVSEKDDSLQIINLLTGTITATLTTGRKPQAVAVSSIFNLAIVVNNKDDSLTLFDLSDNSIINTIPVGKEPKDVAIRVVDGRALVVNSGDNSVSAVDLATQTVVDTLPVGSDPYAVAIHPVTFQAVVTNEESGDITPLIFDAPDTTPPAALAITASLSVAANASGWHRQDVTVAYNCTGGVVGIATCPASVTVSTEGAAQVISRTATDGAGNTAIASVTINLDKTAPTIVNTTSPSANANGWHSAAASVSFTCNDNLSGITTCPATVPVNSEGAGQVINVTVSDTAGNTATTSTTLNIDTTAPVITTSVSPAANDAGWHNSNATITFICSDVLSGVDVCPAPVTVNTEGTGQIVTRSVSNIAGNTVSTSETLNIDETLPVLTITAPAAGSVQLENPPSIAVIYSDANGVDTNTLTMQLDGLPLAVVCVKTPISATCLPSSNFSLGAHTLQIMVSDIAGNVVTTATSFTVDNVNQLPTADAGLGGTVSEGSLVNLSGAASMDADGSIISYRWAQTVGPVITLMGATTITPSFTAPNVATDTLLTFQLTVTDNSGGTATATVNVTVLSAVDITAPVITASATPTANAAGWSNSDVTVSFTCSDTGSGIATCPAPVVVSTEGAGQVISGTAVDVAGNSASTSVALNIDKTAPSVALDAPIAGSVQRVNPPAISVSYSDTNAVDGSSLSLQLDGSPLSVTCSTTPTSTSCVPVAAISGGAHTLQASISDIAGNVTTSTVTFDQSTIDTDGDGLSDADEIALYLTDPANPDTDGDGLSDGSEVNTYLTNPLSPDSDGDGLSDGPEVNTYLTNPANPDSDGDGVNDGDEINAGTDPLDASSVPDLIAPTPVNTGLFTVSTLIIGNPQRLVSGTDGSVEAGALVTATNTRNGSRVQGNASATGSWSGWLVAQSGDRIAILVQDAAGNTSSVRLLTAPGTIPTISVTISAPLDGSSQNDRVDVTGTYRGPADMVIDVNGVKALTVGNQYCATNVGLDSGINTITATGNASSGTTVTQNVSVNSSGPNSIQLKVDTNQGMGAHQFTFSMDNNTGGALSNIEYDVGNGSLPLSVPTEGNIVWITYGVPGCYTASVTATDETGSIITDTLLVVVQDGTELDGQLRGVYYGMLDNLRTGNVAAAMNNMSAAMRRKYETSFNALTPTDLANLADRLGTIKGGGMNGELARYTIVRREGGVTKAFPIFLIRGNDGVWRIAEM